MSEIQLLPDANVRSTTYYVASAVAPCRHCGSLTRLLALALPRDHETLDSHEPDAWQVARANAFLFHIERLPDDVRSRLSQLSQRFRLPYESDASDSYWVNHCEHCDDLLDDQDLHCEMDGAFMPSNEKAARNIQLLLIREPFEALAHGYAIEPEHFQSMTHG